MKEYWVEKMRRKLARHRKSPPAGLWEGISEQMGPEPMSARPEPAQRSAAIWRWSVASAAAVLALAGYFLIHDADPIPMPTPTEGIASVSPTSQQETVTPDGSTTPQQEPSSLALAKATTPVAAPNKSPRQVSSDAPSPTPTAAPEANATVAEENAGKPKDQNADSQVKDSDSQAKNSDSQAEESDSQTENSDSQARGTNIHHTLNHDEKSSRQYAHKWSVGLNASGGLLAAQSSSKTVMVYNDPSYSSTEQIGKYGSSTPHYSLSDYVSEHYLPIRFGLKVNYQFNSRLALLSGVTYTYLYSRFSLPQYHQADFDQRLHYLGIPLGLSFQLWSSQRFHVYVTGGTMVEKCLNDKPWQWSVNAAAGAEYRITPQWGLYAEPSLGYYFNDGTSLEHYYKKHPLAPAIEVGVRLHVNE